MSRSMPGLLERRTGEGEALTLDLAHLDRHTFHDHALRSEVLVLFSGQLPHTLAWLRGAVDGTEWRAACHTLKGSARAIGALRLAKAAEAAEQLPEDAVRRRQALRAVDSEIELLTAALARL